MFLRLLDLFPTLIAAEIPLVADVASNFDPADPVDAVHIFDSVRRVQEGTAPHLLPRLTEGLLGDLERAQGDRVGLRAIAAALCFVPAALAHRTGDFFTAENWVHRAIGAQVDFENGVAEWEPGASGVTLRDPRWGGLWGGALLDIAPLLFNLAAVHGRAGKLAEELQPDIRWLFHYEVGVGRAARALAVAVEMIPWLLPRGREQDAVEMVRIVEDVLYDAPRTESASAAARLLVSLRPQMLRRPPREIARWALDHVDLDVVDRLFVHVAVVDRTRRGWAGRSFSELQPHLESAVRGIQDRFPDRRAQSRLLGRLFADSRWVIRDLMRTGEHRLLWRWLGLCRGIDATEVRDDRCVAAGMYGDAVWYRPDQRLSSSTGRVVGFLDVFNQALGDGVVTVSGISAGLATPATGRKDPCVVGRLEKVLGEWVDAAGLARYARDSGAASVLSMLPGHFPLQALLARVGGPVLPIGVSACAPMTDRGVRRVQLWVDNGLPHALAEARIVRTILANAGIEVQEVSGPAVTRDTFLSAYSSDEFDVIWVASHAGRHPYQHHESAIRLQPGQDVTMTDLLELPAPTGRRRLLVLNACQTGAADGAGPLSDVGLGRSVAGPSQAVIGHLWPVDTSAALLFGALLAEELANRSPFAEAFQEALILLQEPSHTIGERLRGLGIGGEASEAVHDFQSATFLDRASPVFFE